MAGTGIEGKWTCDVGQAEQHIYLNFGLIPMQPSSLCLIKSHMLQKGK
jgi:hypothetical protein